ncbi:hypothetical protein L211DRAFT_852370 [Terfezia boudieri ATCC MYA-4762]|uniref:Uncharacterized protein n=1 Tax=Terfezia boudieri ATCC MYA-4762 TaxID=1051890 RepID=A0A3N4LCJ7_9PEZI|nr:hypothetical protein L211DRAFT_852370 [Terfezia boudieri ATCC MYA-4762]
MSSQAGSSSSAENPAAEGLPTDDVVRTWDSEDLHKWLTSITPPPLGKQEGTKNAFLDAETDGPCFLDAASQRKRPRSSSPIQSLDSKSKKPRVAADSGIDIPVAQASGEALITKGNLQSVEELAAANSHAAVHKLADKDTGR